MIEPIEIVKTQKQAAIVLPVTTTMAELPKVMGPAINELMKAVADQDLKPTSAWWNHYTQMGKTWVFDLGMTTSKKVKPVGRVKAGFLPSATVARTVYTGPYEGLFSAWAAFDQAIADAGHEKGGEIWEVYFKGPDKVADSAKFQTELNRVLKTVATTTKKKKNAPPKKKAAAKKKAAKKKAAPKKKKAAAKKKKAKTKKK